MAWANSSRDTEWHLLFGLLGLPLVHLAGSQSDNYFLLLSVPNSLIWAAGLTWSGGPFQVAAGAHAPRRQGLIYTPNPR